MKRIVILPDLQFGSEDKKLASLFVDFIGKYQPDRVIQVGDLLDGKAPARWSRATADEFAGTLQEELDLAKGWFAAIREVYQGPFDIKEGNHDLRIQMYIERHAPAFASLDALKIEHLLELDEFGIDWHSGAIELAPGWVCMHGHEGNLSQHAGMTALNLAKKIGKSVVCGHTHRAGVINESRGYGGTVDTITGMEVGHAMNMKKAAYLLTGSANWQQALGILYVDRTKVIPSLIPVHSTTKGPRFLVEGIVVE